MFLTTIKHFTLTVHFFSIILSLSILFTVKYETEYKHKLLLVFSMLIKIILDKKSLGEIVFIQRKNMSILLVSFVFSQIEIKRNEKSEVPQYKQSWSFPDICCRD